MQLQFQGLIVHARVTDPDDHIERQIAVLMAAPEHKPIVAIKDEHIDFANTTATRIGHANGVSCYALKDRVENSLGSGLAGKVDLPSVPNLRVVSNGGGSPDTPKDSVKKRIPDTKFHAYVELPPGGNLVEMDYFPDQVDFNSVSFGCIARTVKYDVSAGGNVTFHIKSKDLVLKPEAILYIQNASEEKEEDDGGPPPPPHPHFPEYAEFWEPKATTVHSPDKKTPCPKPTGKPLPRCGGGISLDVDCSNSQFP